MLQMNKISFYYWRFREELCKKKHIFRVLCTKYGLKCLNIKLVRQGPTIISEKAFDIEPVKLFLGIDYLNDDYTLLDTSILDSPHYSFINAILNGEDLSKTDYIERYQRGTLDGRQGRPLIKDFSLFQERCNTRIGQLDDMQPVMVYRVNDRYYIYDGKHRAALCALLGVKVRCILVDYRFNDNALFKIMIKEKEFKKHLSLLS